MRAQHVFCGQCIGLQRQNAECANSVGTHKTYNYNNVCSSEKHCIQLHANSINLIPTYGAQHSTATSSKMRIALYGHSDIDLDVIYLLDFTRLLLLRAFSLFRSQYECNFLFPSYDTWSLATSISHTFVQFALYRVVATTTTTTVHVIEFVCDRIQNQVHLKIHT